MADQGETTCGPPVAISQGSQVSCLVLKEPVVVPSQGSSLQQTRTPFLNKPENAGSHVPDSRATQRSPLHPGNPLAPGTGLGRHRAKD